MCIQCNRKTKELFCSIECACYSGAYSLKSGWNEEKLEELCKINDKQYNPRSISSSKSTQEQK